MRKGLTSLSSGDATPAEETFATAVGKAVEELGQAGGTIAQAEYSLLRYAAQCSIFQGRSEAKFVVSAMKAHQREKTDLRKRANGSS